MLIIPKSLSTFFSGTRRSIICYVHLNSSEDDNLNHVRNTMSSKDNRSTIVIFFWCIIISLFLHIELLDKLNLFSSSHQNNQNHQKKITRLTFISSSMRKSFKNSDHQKQPQDTNKAHKEENEKEVQNEKEIQEPIEGQIVEIPKTIKNEIPDQAKYLSDRNSKVEKETKSKDFIQNAPNITHKLEAQMLTKVEQTQGSDTSKNIDVHYDQKSHAKAQEKKLKSSSESQPAFELSLSEKPLQQKLTLKLDTSGSLKNREYQPEQKGDSPFDSIHIQMGKSNESSKEKLQDGEEKGSDPSGENSFPKELLPDFQTLKIIQGSPSNDYLSDVEEGEETFLNAKQFKYATFFHRVKKGVSQFWNPGSVYVKRDPTGQVFGYKDRYTVLQITLNKNGSLEAATIATSSGLDFLDNEALKAFKKAEPFSNPPQGLLDDHGKIVFTFGFYFEIGRSPSMQILQYRYQ